MSRGRYQDLRPDFVDQVVVDRVLANREGPGPGRLLHHAERVAVARGVVAAGGGYNRVMTLLNCSSQTAKALFDEAKVAS